MKNKREVIGKAAHTVSALVFFIAALIAFAAFLNFAISFFDLQNADGTVENAGEQLGIGISAAVSVIFSVVFGVGEFVLSLIGIPLALTVVKYRDGAAAVIAKIATIINLIILGITLVVFAIMFFA